MSDEQKLHYRKGTQTEKMDKLPMLKIFLVVDGEKEGPWARQGPDYVVLQNNAIAFFPYRSWGVVLPSNNHPGEKREVIDASHLKPSDGLELHPDAWDYYLEHGFIDADGYGDPV